MSQIPRKHALSETSKSSTSQGVASLPVTPLTHTHRYRKIPTFVQPTRLNMDPEYPGFGPSGPYSPYYSSNNRPREKRVSLAINGQTTRPGDSPVNPPLGSSASQDNPEKEVSSSGSDESLGAPRSNPPPTSKVPDNWEDEVSSSNSDRIPDTPSANPSRVTSSQDDSGDWVSSSDSGPSPDAPPANPPPTGASQIDTGNHSSSGSSFSPGVDAGRSYPDDMSRNELMAMHRGAGNPPPAHPRPSGGSQEGSE
jgi:hypothetical protein